MSITSPLKFEIENETWIKILDGEIKQSRSATLAIHLSVNIYIMSCNKERSGRGHSFNLPMFIIGYADRQ